MRSNIENIEDRDSLHKSIWVTGDRQRVDNYLFFKRLVRIIGRSHPNTSETFSDLNETEMPIIILLLFIIIYYYYYYYYFYFFSV